MSLQDVADAINAQSETMNVNASVLKVGENDFQLVLTGAQLGKDIETFSTAGDDVLNLIGMTDGFNGFQNTLRSASGSHIRFDGQDIYRDDNQYDDLIDGIELNLKNASPGTIINLEVGNDVASAKEAITNFIDAYNEYRDFVIKNQQVSETGEVSEDALLFSDSFLDGLSSQYSNFITQSFNNGGVVETIRDLGIELVGGNKLSITDEAKLDTLLLNNFDDVKNAFASSAQTDNDEFALQRNRSVLGSTNIVFDLTTDGAGTITGVTANGDGSAFTIEGNTIVGAQGTSYEGLRFIYAGMESNVTINVDFNQGLSEKILNGTDGYTNTSNGLIVREKASLQTDNQQKRDDISEIEARAERFPRKSN